MGKGSGIAWTDHTFNPWWGCVEVSPACDNCYARTFDNRLGGEHWGAESQRKFFGDRHWNEPRKWDRDAAKLGEKQFVFCASMADVFEKNSRVDLDSQRARLWQLARETRNLVWLLLTKRPQFISSMAPDDIRCAPNVWFGTTVEAPAYEWRVEALAKNAPAAPVRFLSVEPYVEHFDVAPYLTVTPERSAKVDWVITGCESGPNARTTPVQWYRDLRDACEEHGTAFFLKQAPAPAAERCDVCHKPIRVHVLGPQHASYGCACTVEGAEDGAAPEVGAGDGSWLKMKDMLIEQPYLDGVQHTGRPRP